MHPLPRVGLRSVEKLSRRQKRCLLLQPCSICTTQPVEVVFDASSYGLGAVLSTILSDGRKRPIAYASRFLTPSEKNYSQLEREPLVWVYGVKKFHYYIYGRPFGLVTDHKALQTIFGPTTCISSVAAARLERWTITLLPYQKNVVYRSGEANVETYCLSRLPLLGTPDTTIQQVVDDVVLLISPARFNTRTFSWSSMPTQSGPK